MKKTTERFIGFVIVISVLISIPGSAEEPFVLHRDVWVSRWDPVDFTVLKIHIDQKEYKDGYIANLSVTDAKGTQIFHGPDRAWFISGQEFELEPSSETLFLAHWSSGNAGFMLDVLQFTKGQVRIIDSLYLSSESYWIYDVTGDDQPDLILPLQLSVPDKPAHSGPYVYQIYSWNK